MSYDICVLVLLLCTVLLMVIAYMLIEAAEEEQQFQQFRERNRLHHVSYVGTVGKLLVVISYLPCVKRDLVHIHYNFYGTSVMYS